MADGATEVRAVEVAIGTADEIARSLVARRDELEKARARLAELASELERETQVDRRIQWAQSRIAEVESYCQGLRAWGTGASDALAPPRHALFRAARLLAECLADLLAGAALDAGEFEEARMTRFPPQGNAGGRYGRSVTRTAPRSVDLTRST